MTARAAETCQGCGKPAIAKPGGRPRKWCSEKCRKAQYSGKCEECGGPTSGNDGIALAPKRCQSCAPDHHPLRRWNRGLIVRRMHDWRAQYGEAPVSSDWNPQILTLRGSPSAAEAWRRFRDGDWPGTGVVQSHFGSWNQAIQAAGFSPLPQSQQRASRAVSFAIPSVCADCGVRHDSGDLDRCEVNQLARCTTEKSARNTTRKEVGANGGSHRKEAGTRGT